MMTDAEYLHAEQKARFAALGLHVETGRYAGSVQLSAAQAGKLLRTIGDLQKAVANLEERLQAEIGNRPLLASLK